MKAIEYFPFVLDRRAYLAETFELDNHLKFVVTDIIGDSLASRALSTQEIQSLPGNGVKGFDAKKAIAFGLAREATAKHIRAIEKANIAGMEAAIAARDAA